MAKLEYPRTQMAREAKRVCDDWGVPEIPIDINGRLQTCLGRYFPHHPKTGNPMIEMCKWQIEKSDARWVFKTLYHELAHYIQQIIFGWTDHGPFFYETLEAIEAGAIKEV
jgi:hypothetical protein